VFDRVRLVWSFIGAIVRAQKEIKMASTNTVSVAQSSTKKWALYIPFGLAVVAAVHLIPGVPPTVIKWIDWILGIVGNGTAVSGVAIGMRNAVSRNGAGI
jgi:hypothetical protein